MAGHRQKTLKLDVASVGSAKVLTISGSATMAEADRIRAKLEKLAAADAPIIVLDLSKLEFIGSAGLGALIVGHLYARRHHGQMRLVNPNSQVLGILETTHLTKIFCIYATVDEAVNA